MCTEKFTRKYQCCIYLGCSFLDWKKLETSLFTSMKIIITFLLVILGCRVSLEDSEAKWRRFPGYKLVSKASTALNWRYKKHLTYCRFDCKEKASCSAFSYAINWNCTMSECGRVVIAPDPNSDVYIKGLLIS